MYTYICVYLNMGRLEVSMGKKKVHNCTNRIPVLLPPNHHSAPLSWFRVWPVRVGRKTIEDRRRDPSPPKSPHVRPLGIARPSCMTQCTPYFAKESAENNRFGVNGRTGSGALKQVGVGRELFILFRPPPVLYRVGSLSCAQILILVSISMA